MYFQCAEYERLCLGLRSSGCGSLLGHGNDDASRLCSLHHCMHLSWSNNILVSLKRFISRVDGKDDDDEDMIRRRRRNKHVRTDEVPSAEV